MVREHDGLGLLRRARGEEEELPRPVLYAAHQGRGKLLAELLIPPERVDVRIADQGLQEPFRRERVEHDDLQAREVRGKDLRNALEAPVGEDANAAFAALPQFLGASQDIFIELRKAPRLLPIAQRRRVGPLLRPVREQRAKRIESHTSPPLFYLSFRPV